MSEFKPAFQAILANEGFPSYNIDNNKAQVCGGINRAYWPGWGGWPIVDALKAKGRDRHGINDALRGDPRLRPLVENFYSRNFWLIWMGQITSWPVANWAFDKSVNAGVHEAVLLIQRAAGVTADGRLGPKTLNEVNSLDPVIVCKACHDQAVAFYEELHEKDPVKYPADMKDRA
jgi:peptidoglycan hydrolase-like protein with peptidoglycan-binding domain